MTKRLLKNLKNIRIVSQFIFFSLFLFIFIRSLDPFLPKRNYFLKFDPLIFLTNMQFKFSFIIPFFLIIILTLIFGRFFCGWICPLGTAIDTIDFLMKKIRSLTSKPLIRFKTRKFHIKYPISLFILGSILITVIFTPPILQFFDPDIWIIRIFSLSNIGIVFLIILALFSLLSCRLWCKYICPLGAFYGLFSKASFFKLTINKCTNCTLCNSCPMDASYFSEKTIFAHQCILCFNYEYKCPQEGFSFSTPFSRALDQSRRSFLKQAGIVLSGLLSGSILSILIKTKNTKLLRPPGVLKERLFIERCLRCFQCVRSCPNQVIKITKLDEGIENIFTPHLEFTEYGCDYNCQVCQIVCPNYAIPLQPLNVKQKTRIGIAIINKDLCVVYSKDINCLVCEEFCPIPDKAIKVIEKTKIVKGKALVLQYPVVNNSLCTGCGICQASCPTNPKAINITIDYRTK